MKCHKFRQNIVLDLYGELKKNEKTELEKHFKECSSCAKDYAYSRNVFKALEEVDKEDIPEPQWSTSWSKIRTAIQNKPQAKRLFLGLPKWSPALAGVLIIFVLGIFAGRILFQQKQEMVLAEEAPQGYIQKALTEHIDELKPILLQIANYAAEENGNGTVVVDRDILQNLIIQNILLKSLITGQNPSAEQILEDVELVLRQLANMEEDDSRTKSMVKELIDEREILLNMSLLQKI